MPLNENGRFGRRAIGTALALAGLLLAACQDPGVGDGQTPPGPDTDVSVVGHLTDEGVECQALRTDDGALYTLAGDVGAFKAGDRVRVDGEIAEMSTCVQGTTLGVRTIQAAP
jgi:hypothetical protein